MVKWFVRVREVETDEIIEDLGFHLPPDIEGLENILGPGLEVSVTAVSVS
jgi:hypothetical protein